MQHWYDILFLKLTAVFLKCDTQNVHVTSNKLNNVSPEMFMLHQLTCMCNMKAYRVTLTQNTNFH